MENLKLLAHFLFIFCLSAFLNLLNAQTNKTYSEEIEGQITKVENSLRPSKKENLDTLWTLAERMEHYHSPAVSIAVIDNFELVWARAYGWADKAEKIPATTATLFQAASISKSVNALGVLKWVEENNIDLNADINSFLKTWQFKYSKKSKGKTISLSHLLSHTAGISAHGFNGYQTSMTLPSTTQILDAKKPANSDKVKPLFEPGIKFKYSGGGTTITQLILAENTKMAYDQYIKENILEPLGMSNSFYTQPPPENSKSLLATAHWANGTPIKGKYHVYPEMAAAGLWTNPSDLSHYIIEVQKSLLGKSNKIISTEMAQKMTTPFLKDGITGLGVFLNNYDGNIYFNHGGSNEGFKCTYYGSMEGGKGVVIMVNSENFDIIPEIVRSVSRVYDWKGF